MQSRFFGGPILIAFFELTAAAGQSERKPATGPRPVRQSLPILSAEISPGIIFSAGLLISNSDSRKTRPPRHKPPEESETAPAEARPQTGPSLPCSFFSSFFPCSLEFIWIQLLCDDLYCLSGTCRTLHIAAASRVDSAFLHGS